MTSEATPETTRPPVSQAMRSIERAFLIGVEEATEVVLVRHADCYEDLDDTLDDPPLSAAGREQARRLGERLRRLHPAAVVSSPLRRAQETAAQIGLPVTTDDRLVEVAVDSTSGYVHVEEDPQAATRRITSVVDELVHRFPGKRVVVVTHGVLILNYLCDVLRIEPGRLRLLPYYTSLNVVRILGERRMAGALGDIAHLEGMPWLR
ncbi:MAG TPA: histidine phosphatase family protein [Candidatus Dormibacteraeota bacterium]